MVACDKLIVRDGSTVCDKHMWVWSWCLLGCEREGDGMNIAVTINMYMFSMLDVSK